MKSYGSRKRTYGQLDSYLEIIIPGSVLPGIIIRVKRIKALHLNGIDV